MVRPRGRGREGRGVPRRDLIGPVALSAALALAYLVWDPPSADLFAQRFRTWLFEAESFSVIDLRWYAGHHVPAYSVLFPPLAALIGPQLVGALSAVGATAAFTALARERLSPAAAWWFAAGSVAPLLSGRLTFALGVALAMAAALALARRRSATAIGLAALASLASPVAGAFLALCSAAAWRETKRSGVLFAVAAVAPALALNLAFPEGGTFPYVASAFWPVLAASVLVAALLPRGPLRTGAILYVALLVAAFAIPSAMGGNASRLGALLAGPLLAGVLWPERRRLLLLVAPALLYWQWYSQVDDLVQAGRDDSATASYYTGVAGFLRAQPGPVRVEVPFTDQHAESYFLGREVALARGWERQYDRKVNALFYEDGLTAERYGAWLHDTAVTHVALADAPLDYSAAGEAALVRAGHPALREVWRDAHWRVFAVRRARPLASGAARAVAATPDTVTLRFARGGTADVRVRWSPYWVASGACVERAGAWTRVRAAQPGDVVLRTRFAFGRIRATSPRCSR